MLDGRQSRSRDSERRIPTPASCSLPAPPLDVWRGYLRAPQGVHDSLTASSAITSCASFPTPKMPGKRARDVRDAFPQSAGAQGERKSSYVCPSAERLLTACTAATTRSRGLRPGDGLDARRRHRDPRVGVRKERQESALRRYLRSLRLRQSHVRVRRSRVPGNQRVCMVTELSAGGNGSDVSPELCGVRSAGCGCRQ